MLRLKKDIQDTVWNKFGIELTPEVNLVGLCEIAFSWNWNFHRSTSDWM